MPQIDRDCASSAKTGQLTRRAFSTSSACWQVYPHADESELTVVCICVRSRLTYTAVRIPHASRMPPEATYVSPADINQLETFNLPPLYRA